MPVHIYTLHLNKNLNKQGRYQYIPVDIILHYT